MAVSIGANGLSAQANLEQHARLLAELARRQDEDRQARAACDQVRASLQQDAELLSSERRNALQNELVQQQLSAEAARERLKEAYTAVGALELAVGPDHLALLEAQAADPHAPAPAPATNLMERAADLVRGGAELVNDLVENAKSDLVGLAEGVGQTVQAKAQAVVIVAPLLTGQGQPDQLHLHPSETVIELPTPALSPTPQPDLDKALAAVAQEPSREQQRRLAEEWERARRTYEDALANAPSREPPFQPSTAPPPPPGSASGLEVEPPPPPSPPPPSAPALEAERMADVQMTGKHEQQRQALDQQIEHLQSQFDQRHERLGTPNERREELQKKLDEQTEALRAKLAEQQEREREMAKLAEFNREAMDMTRDTR